MLSVYVVVGLPQIMFEETQLDVLEDVGKPIIVCVRLIGGNLMSQPATFIIFSQPGSAQGIYI